MENLLASLGDAGALSKRQQKVARYIAENFETAAFMTAEYLAHAAGVSESTVIRFASEMGYGSYSQLRRALQDVLRGRIGILEQQTETDSSEVIHRAVQRTEKALRDTDDSANAAAFDRLCACLREAQNICICGQGRAYALARYAAACLCELRTGITVLHSFDAPEAIHRLEPCDLLLDISMRNTDDAHISVAIEKRVCVAQIVIGELLSATGARELLLRTGCSAGAVMLIDALCANLSEA